MIGSRGQLRPRGTYTQFDNYEQPRRNKVEEVNDLTGQEHFTNEYEMNEMSEYYAEEAARQDDIEEKYVKYESTMSWASTHYSITADSF
eukprot:4323858-Amphidinium_carterae.1